MNGSRDRARGSASCLFASLKKAAFTGALTAVALLASPFDAQAKIGFCDDPIVLGTTLSETGPFATLADKWRGLTLAFERQQAPLKGRTNSDQT